MAPEHSLLLRRWLMGKGFHPHDIAAALTWFDAECAAGRVPDDEAVLAQADLSHDNAVGVARGVPATPMLVEHTHHLSWVGAALGAFGGGAVGGALYQAARQWWGF